MKSFKQRREEARKEDEHYRKIRDEHEFTKDEITFMIKTGFFIFLIVLIPAILLILLVQLL